MILLNYYIIRKAKVYANTYNNDCEYQIYMSTSYNTGTGTSTSKKTRLHCMGYMDAT